MAEKQNVLLIHENSRLSKMSTSKVSSFYIFYGFFKRLIDWGVFLYYKLNIQIRTLYV